VKLRDKDGAGRSGEACQASSEGHPHLSSESPPTRVLMGLRLVR
jgi:hypothetical protein